MMNIILRRIGSELQFQPNSENNHSKSMNISTNYNQNTSGLFPGLSFGSSLPNCGVVPYLKTPKQPNNNKHITRVIHYFKPSGEYDGSNIAYHISYNPRWRYTNTNIFNDQEYSWLQPSFKKKSEYIRGARVYYVTLSDKVDKAKIKRYYRERSSDIDTLAHNQVINLEQPHYSIDFDDTEFFRMRTCYTFDVNFFPTWTTPWWTQIQHRPCLYIDSMNEDCVFDSNTYYVYLNINHIRAEFIDIIQNIVYGDNSKKKEYTKRFAYTLYIYTMWLYYINVSHGWKFEDINYEMMWNLALYLLVIVKPFNPDPSSDTNWLPFVKVSYVRYLFERRVWNGCLKGMAVEYRDLSKKLLKSTRYCFPDEMPILNQEVYKLAHRTPKKEGILERNKQIKELRNQGKTYDEISEILGCAFNTVRRALKQL